MYSVMYSIIWFCQDSVNARNRKGLCGPFFMLVNEERQKSRQESRFKRVFGVPRVIKYQAQCHVNTVRENVKGRKDNEMGRRSSIVKVAGGTIRKRITIGHVKVRSGRWLASWYARALGSGESPVYWRSPPAR